MLIKTPIKQNIQRPGGVTFIIKTSHGDADLDDSDSLYIPGELNESLIEEVFRELFLLQDCIITARSSGSISHLPDSLIKNGSIIFSNGQEFYPSLDRIFDQRETYAEIVSVTATYEENGNVFSLILSDH